MNNIVRVVEWYSKKTGRIVDEEEIKNFDLEYFKKIFNHTYEDDPELSGCTYEIFEKHVPLVQPFIKHKIDLNKFDYFFGTYEEKNEQ